MTRGSGLAIGGWRRSSRITGRCRSTQLRERMLREVEVFAGAQAQHDDMTWVLVRVE